MRVAAWEVLAGLAAAVLVCSSRASRVAVDPFYPDSSLQRFDSIPPGRPVLALKSIWRGQGDTQLPGGFSVGNSEGDGGSITWTMTFPQAESPHGRFGYTFHLIDGHLPDGNKFPVDARSTSMRGDSAYPYIDWTDGGTWDQDAFSFRVCITAIDSAGNESLPSNIVVVADDGEQEERKRVEYEQRYLGFSSVYGAAVEWTGTDEAGKIVSLVARIWGDIELNTDAGIVRGQYLMKSGKPHRIDIYDNILVGPHIKQLGIYEMHGDSLRLCLAPRGDDRPATFHHDGAVHLYTLRKTSP